MLSLSAFSISEGDVLAAAGDDDGLLAVDDRQLSVGRQPGVAGASRPAVSAVALGSLEHRRVLDDQFAVFENLQFRPSIGVPVAPAARPCRAGGR
jgi:hypothetical protein